MIIAIIAIIIVIILIIGLRNRTHKAEQTASASTPQQTTETPVGSHHTTIPISLYIFGFSPLLLLLLTLVPGMLWGHYERHGYWPISIDYNIWEIIKTIKMGEGWMASGSRDFTIFFFLSLGCSALTAIFPVRVLFSKKPGYRSHRSLWILK